MARTIDVTPWRRIVLADLSTAHNIPDPSNVPVATGIEYFVCDNLGTAGTASIVITCGKIAGSTSTTQTISANGGKVRFVSSGSSGWIIA